MSIARKPVGDEGPHIAPYTGMEAYRDGLEPAHQQHNYSLPRHGPGSSQLSKHEQYTDGPPKQKRKKLCGIPILAFWLLLAFNIAPIAAIAVVGGLLGSSHILIQANSNCNNKRSINDRYNHRHAVYNRRVRMHKEWYRFHLHNWRYLHDTLQPGSWNGESLEQYFHRPRCGECRLVRLMHRCMHTIKAGGYPVDWSVQVLHDGRMSQ